MHFDWVQSKVLKVINEFLPKFINGPRHSGLLKLGNVEEEGSVGKLVLLCMSGFEGSR